MMMIVGLVATLMVIVAVWVWDDSPLYTGVIYLAPGFDLDVERVEVPVWVKDNPGGYGWILMTGDGVNEIHKDWVLSDQESNDRLSPSLTNRLSLTDL